jgi:membrane protein implicated in regulation of membrane protease activity
MNWPAVFLGCFVVGFVLSALSFALSAVALHFHVHVPFVHHLHLSHLHASHLGSGGHLGHAGHPSHAGHAGDGVSPINFATVMAFLAWFGGTGYLLTSEFRWLTLPALAMATLAGGVGAFTVFWIMAHVLWSPDENMQSADYQMVGVLGRVGHSIRAGGTGELIYSHGGTRHSCGARSADGTAIENGAEVVVTAYDRGIAYVRRWDELVADES